MRQVQYDLEVLYVYKLYHFFSLLIFFCPASLILGWRFGHIIGFSAFIIGFLISYFLMMHKKVSPLQIKRPLLKKWQRKSLRILHP